MPHVRRDSTVQDALSCSDGGMRDAENALLHGVAVKTIRRWRRLYQRRGLPRGQAQSSAPCPRCADGALDETAYAGGLCTWALDLVGVAWRRSSTTLISVSRRADVARLDELIGLKS